MGRGGGLGWRGRIGEGVWGEGCGVRGWVAEGREVEGVSC